MNALQRFERTLDFKKTDCVSTFDVIWHREMYGRFAGVGDYLEGNARMCQAAGLDATRGLFNPHRHWMQTHVEDVWGRFLGLDMSQWRVECKGGTAWIAKRPFRDTDGLRQHLPHLPLRRRIEDWYVPFIKRVREVFIPQVVFVGDIPGPLTWGYTYADLQPFCYALNDAPDVIANLMDTFTEWSRIITELWVRHPTGPACMIGEDMAYKTGMLFSPKWLRENLWPRLKYIIEPAKKAGLKCLLHSDGLLNDVLDDLVNEVGIDGLNPIEVAAGMDPTSIRKQFPRLVLLGGIDTSGVLPFGTCDQVRSEVSMLIDNVGSRGLCVGSTNEIHIAVPIENALAMYNAARNHRVSS